MSELGKDDFQEGAGNPYESIPLLIGGLCDSPCQVMSARVLFESRNLSFVDSESRFRLGGRLNNA